ncbi:MAG: hypothetical protein J1G04_03900 [Clostridiales bacterium]|nr:hypothetical protein [Clostridiales bacterium]
MSNKSKFAKFIDATVGSALIFAAAYAVLRYFMPSTFAVLSAVSVTGAVWLIFRTRAKNADMREQLSHKADDFFYEFMFLPDNAPAKHLSKGLQRKGVATALHGNALYTENKGAFFFFDGPPNERSIARSISRAEHYGKKEIIIFSRRPIQNILNADFAVTTVCGDDVYKLFASLDILPESKHAKIRRDRRMMFRAALSKDKIARYFVLSAALFGTSYLLGFSVVMTICASVAAVLCISSIIFAIAQSAKEKAKAKAKINQSG